MRISDWSSDVCSSDLHGPLALREHGNLSRRGIETDRDDADPGRFRGLDGEVPVSTDLGRCRTAVARAFGPKPSSRSEPKELAMNRTDARPNADVPAGAPFGASRRIAQLVTRRAGGRAGRRTHHSPRVLQGGERR